METSIGALLAEYGYVEGEGLLQGLTEISNVLAEHGLYCNPPLGTGDFDTPRVLASRRGTPLNVVLSEIEQGESAIVEFKSSLLVDTKKLAFSPGRPIHDYKSDGVIRSALKSIAAFANGEGGVLYVGVTDDGSICGLESDFCAASPSRSDYDGWDLHFRSLIASRLSDGQVLSQYVQTTCYKTEDEKAFVRVRVASRARLTFVKTGDTWELFMRAGTQTNSIPYAEIEQHFSLSRLY